MERALHGLAAMWIVGRIVFDIDLTQLPVWAH